MPKVCRDKLPPYLLQHLMVRVRQRNISLEHLEAVLRWLEQEPIVPDGKWFKKFSGFTLCREGELVKTFLRA
jgi:hypothetical protein